MTDGRRFAALAAVWVFVLGLGLAGPWPGAGPARADDPAPAPDAAPAEPAAGALFTDPGAFVVPPAWRAGGSAAPGAGAARGAASRGIHRTALERLWLEAADPEARVAKAEGVARQLGVASYDAAGRALLLATPDGSAAEQAARVAHGLPYAQGALASARLRGGNVIGAGTALLAGFAALDRHLEASLWLRAHLFRAVAFACAWGGFAFLLVAGASSLRRAAHDVGDVLSDEMPSWQRLLLVGALVLLPASFGQGAFGLALGLLGLGLAAGDPKQRPALIAAAVACWLGAQPLLGAASRALAAFDADPVALAAWSVESDAAHPGELARLAAAASDDALARRALAVHARRTGDLALADERYAALVDGDAVDPALLNNAGNVRFARGRLDEAIELYQDAAAQERSAVLFFNLAQAYGSDIRSREQDLALARAQSLDRSLVGELTGFEPSFETGLAVDLPTPPGVLRARLLDAPSAPALASALRDGFAPGALGRSALVMALALAAVVAASLLAARGHVPARWCRQCGARCCPRCDDPPEALSVCRDCARTVQRKDGVDAGRQGARRVEVRERARRLLPLWIAASLVLPAVGALRGRRPLLALAGALGFALAVGASPLLPALAPDPLAAGLPGRAALGLVAGLGVAAHLASVGLSRSGRRS